MASTSSSPSETPKSKASAAVTVESFENVNREAASVSKTSFESPDDVNMVIPSKELQGAMWSFCLANSVELFKHAHDQLIVILSFVIGAENFFSFPSACYLYGGVYYFIPYFICLIVIGFPMLFLESAVGQFSALPPVLMFVRLGPAFAGIGWITTAAIFLKTVSYPYRPIRLFYAMQPLFAEANGELKYPTCRIGYSEVSCYNPDLECDQQINGLCMTSGELATTTWNLSMFIMTSTSDALRQLPSELYLEEILLTPDKNPKTFVTCSLAIQQAAVAVLVIFGIRTYVKAAKFLVWSPLIATLCCSIYAIVQLGSKKAWDAIVITMTPRWEDCFTAEAFAWAAFQVSYSLNISDGSMITMSAMKRFKNNFLRDVIVIICADTAFALLGCLLAPPIFGYIAERSFSLNEIISLNTSSPATEDQLSKKLMLLDKDWMEVLFERFPSVVRPDDAGRLVLGITFFFMFLEAIALQYVTYEVLLMSVYRLVPQILRFDFRVSRFFLTAVIFLITFLYSCFLCSAPDGYVQHYSKKIGRFSMPALGLAEVLIIVHAYTLKRFATNIKTMLTRAESHVWRWFGCPAGAIPWLYWNATWVVLTPICLLLMIGEEATEGIKLWVADMSDKKESGVSLAALLTLVLLIPISCVVKLLGALISGTDVRSLFKPQRGWGPPRLEDRLKAAHDEKAERVI